MQGNSGIITRTDFELGQNINTPFAGENILTITGANGWVGKRLCELIGQKTVQTKFAINPQLRLISHSACSDQSLSDIAPASVLTVIHLAGLAHQPAGTTFEQMHVANTEFAVKVAHQALAASCKTFVLVSTAKVMGDISSRPFRESDLPQPNDPYSVTKLAAETALQAIFKDSFCKLIIVRPPLAYGPNAKANFYAMMRWCASKAWLPLGAATAPRSMIYIDNLCDALLWCAYHPQAKAGVYFVKDREDRSVVDWITHIRQTMKLPQRTVSLPLAVLKVVASLAGKRSTLDKLITPLQIDDHQIRMAGWTPPYTTRAATAMTCNAWMNKPL